MNPTILLFLAGIAIFAQGHWGVGGFLILASILIQDSVENNNE